MLAKFTLHLSHGQSPWFYVESGKVLKVEQREETLVRHGIGGSSKEVQLRTQGVVG